MKSTKIILLITTVTLTFNMLSFAQNKKDRFKELVIVNYRTNDSAKKLNVIMTDYIKITSNGQCHHLSNKFNGINFSGYRKDTTFRISDSLMIVLTNFFNADNKLSKHIKNSPPGTGDFTGPYRYIYYLTKNNVADTLISTGTDYDDELTAIFHSIWRLPYPKITYTGKIYHDELLEHKIAIDHQKNKNLPKVVLPPTVKSLKYPN